MNEGLIFWLIVFAIAILQGIGQKRKQSGKGGEGGRKAGRPSPAGSGDRETDSVEDLSTRSGSPATRSVPTTAQREGRGEESSEGMLPAEVWEEIMGLARGEDRKDAEEEPSPVSSYEEGAEPAASPVPAPDPEPAPSPEPRTLRRTEIGGGTREGESVESRRREAAPVPAPVAVIPRPGRPLRGSSVRRDLFGSGSPEELRKAIVLREVLGPPVAYRGE